MPGTQPTLAGYLAFLYGVPNIPTENLPSVQSTATSGTTGTLTDASQNWTANQWAGYSVTDALAGATTIASNTADTLTFTTALTLSVAAGDAYIIAPPVVPFSLQIAQDIVNPAINFASCDIYTLAVYNLATDRLLNFAPDLPGQTYFKDVRGPKGFNLSSVSVGVASQASDQGTAVGILNPEQFKLLTLQDLQTLKTPYGRQYMAFAQMYGRSLWGLT